jgi:hypothetical protein
MSKIILEGVLQAFSLLSIDNKHNGRTYPREAYERLFKSDVRKLIRKNKINKLFNG